MGVIRVARLGEDVLEGPLVGTKNRVADYFAMELERDDQEVRVNNQLATLDTILEPNAVVTIVPNINAGW